MRKHLLASSITTALAATLALSPVQAEEHDSNDDMLESMAEDTSITLSGTVVEARDDEFDLRVGEQVVTVDIEDDIRDGGAYTLMQGDKVTVSGQIEDHFFQDKELEANALHVAKLNTTFIVDEDYADDYGMVSGKSMDDSIEVTGTVISVSPDDEQFRIRAEKMGEYTVEVDELDDDPFDDDGYMKIQQGSRVQITGEIDSDWMEGRELEANSINVVQMRNQKDGNDWSDKQRGNHDDDRNDDQDNARTN